MSIESAKKYIGLMAFSEKVRSAKSVEERTKIVRAGGFDFTDAELAEAQKGALSDEDLAGVAGGLTGCVDGFGYLVI